MKASDVLLARKKRGTGNSYEPYDDQISVLDFSVFGPHLAWQLLRRRKRLLYHRRKGRWLAANRSHVDSRQSRDSVSQTRSVEISLKTGSSLFLHPSNSSSEKFNFVFVLQLIVTVRNKPNEQDGGKRESNWAPKRSQTQHKIQQQKQLG